MFRKGYFLVSGTVFCMISILHLFRVIVDLQVKIGNWTAPMWISWGGFVAASLLFIWAYVLIRGQNDS